MDYETEIEISNFYIDSIYSHFDMDLSELQKHFNIKLEITDTAYDKPDLIKITAQKSNIINFLNSIL